MKELPLDITIFRMIAKKNFLYADKTRHIYNLLKSASPLFLSRPRRFGKSLLISALESALRGQKELFKGLWIEGSDYDFTPNPVIRLNLNEIDSKSVETVKSGLISALKSNAKFEGQTIDASDHYTALSSLLDELSFKYGRKAAVLIDDYDAPVLSQIKKPKLAEKIYKTLQSFYNFIKANEEKRGFFFAAGSPKFVEAAKFFSFNMAEDLTLNPDYADILGFTEEEFDGLFSDRLDLALNELKSRGVLEPSAQTKDLRDKIWEWYGGYSWDGRRRLLNPYSVLHFFHYRSFDDYFAKIFGHPTFLTSFAKKGKIGFKTFNAQKPLFAERNVVSIGGKIKPIVPFAFQTGYLTVSRVDRSGLFPQYFLDIPNLEIRAGLISLLSPIRPFKDPLVAFESCANAFNALISLDTDDFRKSFGSFLKTLAISEADDKAIAERCHSLFLAAGFLASQNVEAEPKVSGRKYPARLKARDGTIFVFEIKYCPFSADEKQNFGDKELSKMKKKAALALRQIDSRKYAKPFLGQGQAIYKVGVAIDENSEAFALIKKEKRA
jgi:hypothetical protein